MAKVNIFGLLFDTVTKTFTNSDGEPLVLGGDWTFEDFLGHNPLQFATAETAERIVEILKTSLPAGIEYEIQETKVGWLGRPQRIIKVSRYGLSEHLNAGLVANSIIRSGSLEGVKADLKLAGILF